MTDTAAVSATTLVVRRTVNAPRDRVFAAWTTPEIMRRFMCPENGGIGELTTDLRVGGAWSIEMIKEDDERLLVRGTYREVRTPERIVYTWGWDEDDIADQHESLVTVDFNDLGTQTEVVLTHERLKDQESRDNHNYGWTSIVTRLQAMFA
jgi:uncharacterized protein YndB with AHSA1/START domain